MMGFSDATPACGSALQVSCCKGGLLHLAATLGQQRGAPGPVTFASAARRCSQLRNADKSKDKFNIILGIGEGPKPCTLPGAMHALLVPEMNQLYNGTPFHAGSGRRTLSSLNTNLIRSS